MSILFQNVLNISPKEPPLKPANSNIYPSSNRLVFSSQSSNTSGGSTLLTLPSIVKLITPIDVDSDSLLQIPNGIGIVNFFQGKAIFVTGATGFLAKDYPFRSFKESFITKALCNNLGNAADLGKISDFSAGEALGDALISCFSKEFSWMDLKYEWFRNDAVLIEKLLRTIPDVGKIYVLIKAKNKEEATKRLKNIINAEIFQCLKQCHGKSYESFMLSKLIPVVGNLREPNLGLDRDSELEMDEEVDIIINSAGNTNFHERYDVAIETNTKGPSQVMAFAKKCKKLKLFLHISTAYVNRQSQGTMMERPLRIIAESSARGNLVHEAAPTSFPTLNIEDEICLALSSAEANNGAREMIELGLERARKYGWENTYTFTKAMGEVLLDRVRGNVPIVILRPSIIESTYRDPFPGWIEGHRMVDPLMTYYGKGHFSGFLGDPDVVMDVVPVDMVVSATLAAIAKHGGSRKRGIKVYHVASSVANPLVLKDMGNFIYQHFAKHPWLDSKGKTIKVKPYKLYTTMDDFSSQVGREMMMKVNPSTPTTLTKVSMKGDLSMKQEKIYKKFMEQAKYLAKVYEPYVFYDGRFDNTSTHSLIESMSEEERSAFHFDVGCIDWEDYFLNVHLPGLRRHVMKERGI